MSGANEMASIIGTVGSDIYLPASSRAIIVYDDREITTGLRVCSVASPIARWFSCPRAVHVVFKRDAISFMEIELQVKLVELSWENFVKWNFRYIFLFSWLISISCFNSRPCLLALTLWQTDLYLDILFAWYMIKIQGGKVEVKYITKEIKGHINTNIIGILCQNVATGSRDLC